MRLRTVSEEYILLKTSLGLRFKAETMIMRWFCREMGNVDIRAVDPAKVEEFLVGRGERHRFRHRAHEALRCFYRFALNRGYAKASPLPVVVPRKPKTFVPHIYAPDEIRRLLAATSILRGRKSPLQAFTYRTLFAILYGAGLRLSEAMGLSMADADLAEGVLTIRASKFYKTRLVPVGPRLLEILKRYAVERRRLPLPRGETSTLLAAKTGRPLRLTRVEDVFRMLRARAGISCPGGRREQPRLHDLRHTFAVRRLEAWYREGADVQRLLPHLATYLGHVDLDATSRYLTMTPELLRRAGNRFERYAITEVK